MPKIVVKTEKTETAFVNISIHPKPRKLAARLRRRANQIQNRVMRADINREYKGENGSKRAGEYHQKLKELGMGLLHG